MIGTIVKKIDPYFNMVIITITTKANIFTVGFVQIAISFSVYGLLDVVIATIAIDIVS